MEQDRITFYSLERIVIFLPFLYCFHSSPSSFLLSFCILSFLCNLPLTFHLYFHLSISIIFPHLSFTPLLLLSRFLKLLWLSSPLSRSFPLHLYIIFPLTFTHFHLFPILHSVSNLHLLRCPCVALIVLYHRKWRCCDAYAVREFRVNFYSNVTRTCT